MTSLDEDLKKHCDVIEGELKKREYDKKYQSMSGVKRLLQHTFDDPMTKRFEKDKELPWIMKRYSSDHVEGYLNRRETLVKIVNSKRDKKTKEKFIGALRELDKYDDANMLSYYSYETTDAIKDNISADVQTELLNQKNMPTNAKEMIVGMQALFKVNENGEYVNQDMNDVIAAIEVGNNKMARSSLARAIK